MKVYGGFISAIRGTKSRTAPIALVADSDGEALLEARKAAFQHYPECDGYTNHNFNVVAANVKLTPVLGVETG